MSLIVGKDITRSYGDKDVLKGVGFSLEAGDRVGLVGRNGEGKTTLLRLLAGLDQPTMGRVQFRRGLSVAYLPQEPPVLGGQSLWDAMLAAFADLRGLQGEMDQLAARLAGQPDDRALLRRFGRLQEQFEARGGYDYEVRIRSVLTGLGFSGGDYARPLAQFSGGQRTRAELARMLLAGPDVLLLDEPTNHLDLAATEWLERYLASFRDTLVVVSHDRYFLDKTTGRTWEIAFTSLEAYRGNYSAHLVQRAHRFDERMKVWQSQQQHIAKTEEFIRRHHAASRAREAHGRKVRLERFIAQEAVDKPLEHQQVHIRLRPRRRSGDLVFKLVELSAGYEAGKPLLTVADQQIARGQRIAVVGPNGVGKTTLLRTLLGELAPLAGEAQVGSQVDLGYLPQMQNAAQAGRTALDAVLAVAGEGYPIERARTLLGGFLLAGDEVHKRLDQLSGGQWSRVQLARLAVTGANVLVLDEPTNHLDIASQEVLQEALAQFDGTIIFVSHDRYLIDHLSTHIWVIEGGGVHVIRGRWNDYLAWKSELAAAAPPAAGKPARPARKKDQRRELQGLQRRQERLEVEIHGIEARLRQLSQEMSDASVADDLEAVHRLAAEYAEGDEKLKSLWRQWEELTEQLEQ